MTGIKDRAGLLLHHAKQILRLVQDEGIQIPVTVKYEGAEVYVTRGWQDTTLRVDIKWEVPP